MNEKPYNQILRELREDRDLTQEKVAEVLHTTQQYYGRYENGHAEMPVRVLATLTDLFGVSADYILGRTKCMEGVDALNMPVTNQCTVGEMASSVLAMDEADRRRVLEYIDLLRGRMRRGNEKNQGE